MSHFSVLVIGPDPEAQLAAYDETLEVERYKAHESSPWFDRLAKENGVDTTDLHAMAAFANERWDDEERYEVDDDGLYQWSTRNPNGFWDYWRIGGRYRGFLRLNPGAEGSLAELSYEWTFNGPCTEDWTGRADQAMRGAVDLTAIQAACQAEHGPYRTYAVVAEGAWKGRGQMGWFGVSHDETMTELEWVDWWDRLVGGLSGDTLLTVVDCHV